MPDKIIVVETPQWLERTLQALRQAGYEADGFGTGEAGLVGLLHDPSPYSLIITGSLPGAVNALNLLEAMRSNPATCGIPAIYHGSVRPESRVYIETLAIYVQKDHDKKRFDRLLVAVGKILK